MRQLKKAILLASVALLLVIAATAIVLKVRGLRASSNPSAFETATARTLRNFAIPAPNAIKPTP